VVWLKRKRACVMADKQDTNAIEATEPKKGKGWVLVLWLLSPVVILVILTILGQGK
jgi:hypothetical protein